MRSESILCVKRVGGTLTCANCNSKLVKHGLSAAGKTRYKCLQCRKTCVASYSYRAYDAGLNEQIITFTREGLGIRSTARVLQISTTTLLRRIKAIAQKLPRPILSLGGTYEVDEVRTFVKCKKRLIWIAYALERQTKKVVSFCVGPRTNHTLSIVLKTLSLCKAKRIYTDQLQNYQSLLASMHQIPARASMQRSQVRWRACADTIS